MYMNSSEDESSSSDDEYARKSGIVAKHQKLTTNVLVVARVFGMYYYNSYLNKSTRRQVGVTGYDWVIKCLNNRKACYKCFRSLG
jgi:hypothetical protein